MLLRIKEVIFCIFIIQPMVVFTSDNNAQSQKIAKCDILRSLEIFEQSQQQEQAHRSESILRKGKQELGKDEERKNLAIKEAIESFVISSGKFEGKSVAQTAQTMAEERERRYAAVQRKIEEHRAKNSKTTATEKHDLD